MRALERRRETHSAASVGLLDSVVGHKGLHALHFPSVLGQVAPSVAGMKSRSSNSNSSSRRSRRTRMIGAGTRRRRARACWH